MFVDEILTQIQPLSFGAIVEGDRFVQELLPRGAEGDLRAAP